MTGAPIYLVSACASGEEFVAAFRRYADKNGLFIPIAAPIPAGRRGRFAVTLTDGGVMIEGEADIVSSATTPSVLHGRVGMTLRFIEPDIRSKTVLVELEAARLAMKPAPPSVPPRPAQIPAEPRAKLPTISGRIDANNARAECVAIGDIARLEETVPQVTKSGPKFVVPSIPPVAAGQRPKSPSTPPLAYPALEKKAPTPPNAYPALAKPATPPRPQTPSAPPPLSAAPAIPPAKPGATPFVPAPVTPGSLPTVVAAPLDVGASAPVTPMSITTIDAPIVSPTPSVTPMSITTVNAPITTSGVKTPSVTSGWDSQVPDEISDDAAETDGEQRDTIAMAAIDPAEVVATLAKSRTASDELTVVPQAREAHVFQAAVPPGSDSDAFTAVGGVPEPLPEPSPSKPNGSGSARVALPPPRRTSGNTNPPPRQPTPAQPLPIVRQPTPAQPMPVITAKPTSPGVAPLAPATSIAPKPSPVPALAKEPSGPIATPRGSPTRIGLPIVDLKTPAQPSGEIPLPPVVAEAKPVQPVPELADEPTDITSVPVLVRDEREEEFEDEPAPEDVADKPSVPGGQRRTVIGVAVVPEGMTVLPASPAKPAPKPTEDAIAAPPTVEVNLDTKPEDALAAEEPAEQPVPQIDDLPKPQPVSARGPVIEEPSGDWTMVPGATGPTIIPRTPGVAAATGEDGQRLPTGDWTIARVEDSPSGWSEPSKVDIAPLPKNIRANTGPPVAMVAGEKPLEVTMTAKAFDIEEETKSGLKIEVDESLPVERQISVTGLESTQFAAPQAPMLTPPPGTLSPMAMMPAQPPSMMAPMPRVPSAGSGSFPDYPTASRQSAPASLFDQAAMESTSVGDNARKKRLIIIGVSAGAAIAIGVVLLIVFGLSGGSKAQPKQNEVVTPPLTPDAASMAAVDPPQLDAAAVEVATPDAAEAAIPDKQTPPPPADCTVEITSMPPGAEILRDKDVLGETPAKLTLPCGVETKLVVRKGKLGSVTRVVKATDGQKIKIPFAKQTYSVKVTSSPPGATITMAGKSLGVTPAMVKLTANEAATLTISKTGFTTDMQKITPKTNNQSVHATLKKKGR